MRKKKPGILLFCVLLILAQTITVFADNTAIVKKAQDMTKNATYAIPTATNEIEGWPQGPAIMCDAGVLIEAETGTVLYDKDMDKRMYPASTTKIMTALVALENSSLTDVVTFTQEGLKEAVPGNAMVTPPIVLGENMTMEQCLYAVLLVSGNEVSTQVALQVGGSLEGFLDMMNKKAEEIGCKNTHFVNANGLHDDNHYTTARDLAMIGRAAYANEDFRRIVGTASYTIPPTNLQAQPRELTNHHALLVPGDWHYEGCTGGKTGYTDTALNTLVTFFEKNDMTLVSVAMHYKGVEPFTDSVMLAEYADQFEKIQGPEQDVVLKGGKAVVPKGVTADTLMVERTELTDRYLYKDHVVGGAALDETKLLEKEKQIEEQKIKEQEEAKAVAEEKAQINYTPFIKILTVLILAGLVVILLSLLVIAIRRKIRKKKTGKKKSEKK